MLYYTQEDYIDRTKTPTKSSSITTGSGHDGRFMSSYFICQQHYKVQNQPEKATI